MTITRYIEFSDEFTDDILMPKLRKHFAYDFYGVYCSEDEDGMWDSDLVNTVADLININPSMIIWYELDYDKYSTLSIEFYDDINNPFELDYDWVYRNGFCFYFMNDEELCLYKQKLDNYHVSFLGDDWSLNKGERKMGSCYDDTVAADILNSIFPESSNLFRKSITTEYLGPHTIRAFLDLDRIELDNFGLFNCPNES